MFSFCVANDDTGQATTEGSASLALLLGGGGWVVVTAEGWLKGTRVRKPRVMLRFL